MTPVSKVTSTTISTRDVESIHTLTKKIMISDGIIDRPTVSLVIPTLNEAKNLPLILPFIPMDWVDEVILVDGRSTDNTVEAARQILPSIKVVMEKRKGKGIAMRSGYAASTCDIIVLMDADGSNDPREIPRLVRRLMEGVDMVKGSRFASGGGTTDMTFIRKLGNWGLAQVANLLFSQKYTDLCFGLHAFWRSCLDVLELDKYDGFEIDTGLYLQVLRKNLRVVEEPSFEGERFYGSSNLNAIKDGIRVLKTIFRERFAHYRPIAHHMGFRGRAHAIVQENPMSRDSNFDNLFILMQSLAFSQGASQMALKQALKCTINQLDAANGTLVLLDDQGNMSDSCLVGEAADVALSSVPAEILHNGLAGWVVKNRQPVLISNTTEDPRWLRRQYEDVEYAKSALAVPLILGGLVIGVLTLTRPSENQFTENDLFSVLTLTRPHENQFTGNDLFSVQQAGVGA